jgi:hypothetical protein
VLVAATAGMEWLLIKVNQEWWAFNFTSEQAILKNYQWH